MADRLITINIRRYLVNQPRTKRARKAVKYIRERVAHYTKIPEENIKMSYDLNALIFKQYSRTMVPVKLRIKIGTDTADILPFQEIPTKPTTATTEQKKEKKPIISKEQPKKEEPKQAQQPVEKPKQKKQEAKPSTNTNANTK